MKNWYALHCYGGKEGSIRNQIESSFKNLTTYFPKRELEIRKTGKIKTISKPLFNGYIFIGSDTDLDYFQGLEICKEINSDNASNSIYGIAGVHTLKGKLGSDTIEPIRNSEMERIFSMTDDNETISFSSYLKIGQFIQIISGPLKGREGIIIKINARKKRVKIALTLFGQSQHVDLGAEMVA